MRFNKKYDTMVICLVHLKEGVPDLLLCVPTVQDVGIKLKIKMCQGRWVDKKSSTCWILSAMEDVW